MAWFGGCGGLIYKVVDVDNSDLRNVEIAMCVFSPNEVALRHHHDRMEEIYFVLEGEGEIELNGTWRKIRAEDCVSVPIGTNHRVRNTHAEKNLRFLSINSPMWQDSDMIRTGE